MWSCVFTLSYINVMLFNHSFTHTFMYSLIHRFRNTAPIECQVQGTQQGSKVTGPAILTSDSLIFMALDLMEPAY